MEMTDENTSTLIVNIHGLLGEQGGVQIEFEEELLVEEGEFVLDEVRSVSYTHLTLPTTPYV